MTTLTGKQYVAAEPHNDEAERGLLGSLLIDPAAYIKVADSLKPDYFYSDGHKTLYTAITELNKAGIPADFITLCDHLESQEKLYQVQGSDHTLNGHAYIASLVDEVPTSANAKYYADIIKEEYDKRAALRLAEQMREAVLKATAEQKVASLVQGLVADFLKGRGPAHGPMQVADVVESWLMRLDKMCETGSPVIGVPTGYHDLDKLLSGFLKKTLNILAARPAIGKSSLALNMAYNAAKAGYTVIFYSMEMSIEELITKLVALVSGIDSQRLKTGNIYDDEWQLIVDAIKVLSDLPLWIDDSASLSVLDVKMRSERLQVEQGLDLVVVDYLQLMRATENTQKSGDRVRIVSEISRDLKVAAGELDIPILALSQLSRAVESRADKRPLLSDLRESGSIEQDSNVVMFIYRDEVYNPDTEHKNMADIHVAKHRSGPEGTVRLYFKAANTSFHNVTHTFGE